MKSPSIKSVSIDGYCETCDCMVAWYIEPETISMDKYTCQFCANSFRALRSDRGQEWIFYEGVRLG